MSNPFLVQPRLRAVAMVFVAGLGWPAAQAQPSVPWTPGVAARHAIEFLVDEAGLDLTTTQWPLPLAAVVQALDALPATLPAALDAAREQVRRELQAQRHSQLSLTVRPATDALSGFGDEATPGSSLAVRTAVAQGPRLALQLGGRITSHANVDRPGAAFRLDETALVTEALGVELQAWTHRAWWSPGWQNALALSQNAPAFSGIGLQRASASTSDSRWFAWMGPWNAAAFIAQTEDVQQPANPFLVGARLTLRPFTHAEIGLTRTAQWGGRGRHPSVGSLLRLVTGAGTNADTEGQQAADPGNQMSGFDLRVRCPTGLACAVYGQLIGEDEAGHLPSRYLGIYGIETWTADGSNRFFAEYAETGCGSPVGQAPMRGCAYRNYAYPEGYVSAGRWIGASAGPDARLLTLGWIDGTGRGSVRLHLGSIGSRIGTYSPLDRDPQHSGHLVGLTLQHRLAWGAATVTPELDWSRLDTPSGVRNQTRLGVTLRMDLDQPADAAGRRLADALSGSQPAWNRVLVGAGLVVGAAMLDRPLDDYAQHHGGTPSVKALRRVGDLLPVAGIGLAGLSWFLRDDPAQRTVDQAALLASATAVVTATAVKFVVNRSRPSAGQGAADFSGTQRASSAFPSVHSALAWAVLTPYAQRYDAPWLYGLAALTNAARVSGRQHWFSDTIGGALLGYAVGDHFARRSADTDHASGARLWLTPQSVVFQMPL